MGDKIGGNVGVICKTITTIGVKVLACVINTAKIDIKINHSSSVIPGVSISRTASTKSNGA